MASKKKIVKKVIATKKTAKVIQKSKKNLKAKPVKKTSSKKKIAKPVKKNLSVKKAKKVVAKKTLPVKKNKLILKTQPVKKVAVKKSEKISKAKKKLPEKTKILASIKPVKPEKAAQVDIIVGPKKVSPKKATKPPKPKKIQSVYIIKNELLNLKLNLGKTPKKEPKGKYSLEYVVNCSPSILYEFLTTPSGLCEWFADDVNIRDNQYSFIWDGGEQIADILEATPNKILKLKWSDRNDGSYFQFSIETDDLTNDVSLIITDFSENEAEKKSSQMLWDTQIQKLLHVIGSW